MAEETAVKNIPEGKSYVEKASKTFLDDFENYLKKLAVRGQKNSCSLGRLKIEPEGGEAPTWNVQSVQNNCTHITQINGPSQRFAVSG